MDVTLVGIAGGSCAGKTALAEGLASRLGDRLTVLQFDHYYRDHGHLPMRERALVNYDHPDSLDGRLFVTHLDVLAAGRAVEAPVYDFATHRRTSTTDQVGPSPVVAVDGILLLAFPAVRQRLGLVVYVDAPAEVRLERRVVRDVAERGRTEAGVRAQFAATVAPMYEQWVAPFAQEADLLLDGLADPKQAVEAVLGRLAGPAAGC